MSTIRGSVAAVALSFAGLLGPAEGWSACLSTVGKDASYFTCTVGIEHWEEGKRSEAQHQQWSIDCSRTKGERPECKLTRTVFVDWGKTAGLTIVTVHKHSSGDETLRMIDGEWEKGKLDFDFVYPDETRVPVRIRLKPVGTSSSVMSVDSFDAFDTIRGVLSDSLVRVQYKVPEYGYVLNVPIAMDGRKSAEDKIRDDFNRNLTPEDREAWLRFQKSDCMDHAMKDESQLTERLKREFPQIDVHAEKLSPDQEASLNVFMQKYFIEMASGCLASSGMSREGQDGALKIFRALPP